LRTLNLIELPCRLLLNVADHYNRNTLTFLQSVWFSFFLCWRTIESFLPDGQDILYPHSPRGRASHNKTNAPVTYRL